MTAQFTWIFCEQKHVIKKKYEEFINKKFVDGRRTPLIRHAYDIAYANFSINIQSKMMKSNIKMHQQQQRKLAAGNHMSRVTYRRLRCNRRRRLRYRMFTSHCVLSILLIDIEVDNSFCVSIYRKLWRLRLPNDVRHLTAIHGNRLVNKLNVDIFIIKMRNVSPANL